MTHITSLAFADDAFENPCFTLGLLHKLRVPDRLHVLPLPFKRSILNTPIFRSTVQAASGVHTHPTRPMLYHTTNDALKRLEEIAGYRYPIHYYYFRRYVANEAKAAKVAISPKQSLRLSSRFNTETCLLPIVQCHRTASRQY
jgi:hypothetical protein